MTDVGLFEVVVIPHDPDLARDMDLRFSTLDTNPASALTKIKRYLSEKDHIALKLAIDYVVHRRSLIE